MKYMKANNPEDFRVAKGKKTGIIEEFRIREGLPFDSRKVCHMNKYSRLLGMAVSDGRVDNMISVHRVAARRVKGEWHVHQKQTDRLEYEAKGETSERNESDCHCFCPDHRIRNHASDASGFLPVRPELCIFAGSVYGHFRHLCNRADTL